MSMGSGMGVIWESNFPFNNFFSLFSSLTNEWLVGVLSFICATICGFTIIFSRRRFFSPGSSALALTRKPKLNTQLISRNKVYCVAWLVESREWAERVCIRSVSISTTISRRFFLSLLSLINRIPTKKQKYYEFGHQLGMCHSEKVLIKFSEKIWWVYTQPMVRCDGRGKYAIGFSFFLGSHQFNSFEFIGNANPHSSFKKFPLTAFPLFVSIVSFDRTSSNEFPRQLSHQMQWSTVIVVMTTSFECVLLHQFREYLISDGQLSWRRNNEMDGTLSFSHSISFFKTFVWQRKSPDALNNSTADNWKVDHGPSPLASLIDKRN